MSKSRNTKKDIFDNGKDSGSDGEVAYSQYRRLQHRKFAHFKEDQKLLNDSDPIEVYKPRVRINRKPTQNNRSSNTAILPPVRTRARRKNVKIQHNSDPEHSLLRCPYCQKCLHNRMAFFAHCKGCKYQHQSTNSVEIGEHDPDYGEINLFDNEDHCPFMEQQPDVPGNIVNVSQISDQIAAERGAPQEEALGYDNYATYSRKNISDLAKSVLRRERRIAIEESSSDDIEEENVQDFGGVVSEDLLLSDTEDSDFSVPSEDDMSTGEDFSQNNLDGGSDSLNTLSSLTDKWQDFREVDDVSDLKVHTIPEKIDPQTVPKLTVAMLDLLERIESHSGPAINLFDEIMQWVLFFSRKYPRVFIDIGTGTPTTRTALLN